MKKLLPFIIILSLILPFFPSIEIFAFDEVTGTVSMDDILDDLGLVNVDGLIVSKGVSNLSTQIVNYLGQLGYVTRDNATDVVIDYLANDAGIPYAGSSSNSFNAQDVIDWLEANYTPSLSQNIITYSTTYAVNNTPYYIYDAMPVSKFFNFFSFINDWNQTNYSTLKENLISKVNSLDTLCAFTIPGTSITRHPTYLISISQNMIDNYYFYKRSGIFWNFPDYLYQAYTNQVGLGALDAPPSNALSGHLSFSDGSSEYQGVLYFYGNGPLLNQTELSPMSDFYNYLYCGCYNDFQTNGDWGHFSGTCYLVPDSWGIFRFLVFKDNANLFAFISGNSKVYKFNPDVDLSQYGNDINFDKLYDIISWSISGSTGNVIDAIDYVANEYLQEQIDLLHDINNALNDGNGQSWLRKIYDILDSNFPLTLTALHDLKNAIDNISVSGGGGDFSEATQVLHDIDLKLGILIDEPFTDLTDNDWNDMKSRIQTKFPFCIFSDIVAISVILNRPPQQPDLNFPVPIMGSESDNMVHIDLSPYEHARPYVHGVLIFVFIIGLLALSVKIFDHLKS